MNIDLPLILVVGTAVTGLVVLADRLWLAARRQAQATSVAAAPSEPVWVEYSKSFFPVLLIVLVLRSFLFEPFQIPSGSMIPTLEVGDFILVNKYSYGVRLLVVGTKVVAVGDPQRGDVMVFRPPHKPDTNFIKRVIGVGGDTVRYENRRLTVNGQPVPQRFVAALPVEAPQLELLQETLGSVSYAIQHTAPLQGRVREWVIPQGYYFVMGDNRDNSSDSRVWGLVPDELVVGKAFVIWMHWPSFWSIPSFGRDGLIH